MPATAPGDSEPADGRVGFGGFSFGGQAGPDGDSVLATITLTAREQGISPLALEAVQVTDTLGLVQEVDRQDGRVQEIALEDGRVMVGVRQRAYLPLLVVR